MSRVGVISLPTIDENYRAIDRKYWTVSRQPFSLFAERGEESSKKRRSFTGERFQALACDCIPHTPERCSRSQKPCERTQ